MTIDPRTLLALCVWDEARGEPNDGKAAVARVVKNRMLRRYCSDGTIVGTVLKKFQFSGFWFAFDAAHHYHQIEFDFAGAEAEAEKLLVEAQADSVVFAICRNAADQVFAGNYHGPQYDQLTDDAVLYVNPAVVEKPVWATPEAFVCTIGHHDFYRAT